MSGRVEALAAHALGSRDSSISAVLAYTVQPTARALRTRNTAHGASMYTAQRRDGTRRAAHRVWHMAEPIEPCPLPPSCMEIRKCTPWPELGRC